MKLSRNSKLAAGFALILIAASSYWWLLPAKPVVTDDVRIGTVRRQDLIQRITITGPISSQRRLDIKPSFIGFVQKIHVKIGDLVKPGDPLVTFSPSLSHSETNYPVRATFAGKVTQILKTEGEYVIDTGDQNLVLRVEDLSELYVVAGVAELDIAKVKTGQKATIKVSALLGESFAGEISEIALSARDKERWGSSSTEFQVKVLLKSHDPRLYPGISALCDVVTARADHVLELAHEYIQQDSDEKYFVTRENGEKQQVILGLQTDEGAEIKEGLKENDRVRVIDFLTLPKVPE